MDEEMWNSVLQNTLHQAQKNPHLSHHLNIQQHQSPMGSSSNAQYPQYHQLNNWPVNPYSIPHYLSNPHYQTSQYNQQQTPQYNQPQTSQYNQQQTPQHNPPLSPYIPTFDTSFEEEEHETVQETQPDVEEVEETQETAASKKGKRAKVMWSDEESRILAECWMRATLNPDIGNAQTHNSFWGTIREDYNSQVREQRRADQISGKWTKMAKDIKLFVAIYEKLVQHWPSGANDNDILVSVKKAFREQQKKVFAYEDAWRVVKECPQFKVYETVVSAKRRATEPDPVNLGDADETPTPTSTDTPSINLENLFRGPSLRRPPGRAKSQKSSCSSDAASRCSSDDARAAVYETANATRATMLAIKEEAEKRTKKLEEEVDARVMLESLKLLSQPVSSDIPPDQYELLMRARSNITKKYKNKFTDE